MNIFTTMDEKLQETKQLGLSQWKGKHEVHFSQDLKLEDLKLHAKSLGMTIGELFNSALVVSHTKLDLPEER